MEETCEKAEKLANGAQMISFRAPALHASAFSVVLPFVPEGRAGAYHCAEHLFFERAGEKQEAQFPLSDEGLLQAQVWLQEQYDAV